MSSRKDILHCIRLVTASAAILFASAAHAQTPGSTLLVLAKSDNTVAIVDPVTLQILARVAAGPDPHEIIASDDGKLAYISNYGGSDSDLHTISVVDLVAQTALPPIDLGALRSTHGLAFAGGKLYFTAETNKVIGSYDPPSQRVDWILGTGQDRSHMIVVSKNLEQIFTSNVNSGTISIIEHMHQRTGAPAPGGPRLTWEVTNVPAGNGVEGFDVSPDGKEIWAANARDGTVTILDVASKKASQTIPVPVKGANRLKFTPDGKRVLISGLGAGSGGISFLVMDTSTRKEVKQFSFGGGAAGILITPDGSRAYVAVSASDKVAVVDLKTLDVVGQFSAGRQPDGLAWAVRK